jgi:hypothetical protein
MIFLSSIVTGAAMNPGCKPPIGKFGTILAERERERERETQTYFNSFNF